MYADLSTGLSPIRINKALKRSICSIYERYSLSPIRINKALKHRASWKSARHCLSPIRINKALKRNVIACHCFNV